MRRVLWAIEDSADWIKDRVKRAWQAVTGWWLNKRLASDTSVRSDAENAVRAVVWATEIAPDCVSACELRGGPCILVKHDGATEAIIHKTYMQAADEAIRYIQTHRPITGERSQRNRAQRRAFDGARRKRQRKDTQYFN